MKGLYIIFLLVLSSVITHAQMASAFVHRQLADSIVHLFNREQFATIYQLTTPEFKENIKEKDVVDLLENGLYKIYGAITELKDLREDTGYFAYLLLYKEMKVQMNIGVNEEKQIAFFQLLPYKESGAAKRTNYYSDNKKISTLDTLIDAQVRSYVESPQNSGLSIAVLHQGVEYYYNYGESDRDSKEQCSKRTLYEIGSITKTFCGILLGQAIAEGRISADEPVTKFLPGKYPGLNSAKKPVLIKHLANHTSGLPRIPENLGSQPGFDSLNPYKNYNRQMMLDYLKTVKLASEPGLELSYSNLGMSLLGFILEEVYGQSFEALVRTKITVPNQMTSTAVILTEEQQKQFATGYDREGKLMPHWDLGIFSAAGSIKSTSADMLKYMNYNLKEPDKATVLSHTAGYSGKQSTGFAWFITKTKAGNTLTWHNGGTFGFRSFCGFIKEKDCAVVILGNSATDVDYIGIAILNYFQK